MMGDFNETQRHKDAKFFTVGNNPLIFVPLYSEKKTSRFFTPELQQFLHHFMLGIREE